MNQHIEIVAKIAETTGQSLKIKGNEIIDTETGKPLHSHLVKTIFKMRDEGQDYNPLFKFLNRVQNNPSRAASLELYEFLSNGNLPICEDGCFLGYKRVTEEYLDLHTKKVNNKVGTVVSMPRNQVDDDNRTLCSTGFHVGHWDYVQGFGRRDQPIIIVKVDPADVVAVDCGRVKLRTCKYEVIAHCKGKMDISVYTVDKKKADKDRISPKQGHRESKLKRVIKSIKKKAKINKTKK